MESTIKRISLWSGPRNVSTALMYSFAQRADTKVFDEPLYGYYLSNSNASIYHPGADLVTQSMETDGQKVVAQMLTASHKPVLFFKNMAHHLSGLDRSFLKHLTNIILTRDPIEMLPSFAEVIHTPTLEDVGYKIHLDLVEELKAQNQPVIVLDSKSILLNPEKQLKKLCELIGISFDPNMLSWVPGPRPEDGCWAEYWYKSVHQSSGFNKYTPKSTPFPEHLMPLLKACQPYYDQLIQLAI